MWRSLVVVALVSACAHRPDPLRDVAKLGGACRTLHARAAHADPATARAAAEAIEDAPDKRARCREILDDWTTAHHHDDENACGGDEGD